MIGHRDFIRSFSSFWHDTIPFGETFVRDLNRTFAQSFARPFRSRSAPERRALVNELAFCFFQESVSTNRPVFVAFTTTAIRGRAVTEAYERVKLMRSDSMAFPLPTHEEQAEAYRLGERILDFFQTKGRSPPIIRPQFPGCGVLDQCEGDVVVGDTLFEVKGVERGFRSEDIRQLLTYFALATEGGIYSLSKVGLMNPRQGIEFTSSIKDLCTRLGAASTPEVLQRIVAFLSSGGASR